ncbi:MAG: hypothetical protein ABJO27_09155 [Pseudoruegeria sp.]
MKSVTAAMITSALMLSACSGNTTSPYNPFTWFSAGEEEGVIVTDTNGNQIIINDPRVLVSQTLSLTADDTNGGVIIRAVGLPPTQGYFKAGLFALNDEKPVDGVLTYEFRVAAPLTQQPVSTQQSREIYTGHFISNERLQGVREIRVNAANNTRTLRP